METVEDTLRFYFPMIREMKFETKSMLIEAMEAYADQFKPKWIPVKQRLPKEEGESYLVIVKNKNKDGGIYLHDIGYFEEGVFHKSNTWEDVTHWMPLPEPPKP